MSLYARRTKVIDEPPLALSLGLSTSRSADLSPPSLPSSPVSDSVPLWSPPLLMSLALSTPPLPEHRYHLNHANQGSPLSPEQIERLQDLAFASLEPEDVVYVRSMTRLLDLRDSEPLRCANEAMAVMHDPTSPRCWRARAGVYRAEALWSLGHKEHAKAELEEAGRILRDGEAEERYAIMETLVALNVYMGKLYWGDTSDDEVTRTLSSAISALDLSSPTGFARQLGDIEQC